MKFEPGLVKGKILKQNLKYFPQHLQLSKKRKKIFRNLPEANKKKKAINLAGS